ncbi:MAG: protein GlmU, partial [Pseudomonadota bacterium]
AVFLAGASMGSNAHVRAGTILEEQASAAHSVGLKHTILFPFVTLGSLINFCDIFMAGGTSRENHSEVGSSYVHFNYTPQQDKATASLLGDVPQGVTLRENPIFLGGQGGLVGPCVIAYGTVIAAGSLWRKDQPRKNRLIFDGIRKRGDVAHVAGHYRAVKRTVLNNVEYIANLIALQRWYHHVRSRFAATPLEQALHQGLTENCEEAIRERINRFHRFCVNMDRSTEIHESMIGDSDTSLSSAKLVAQKKELHENCDPLVQAFSLFVENPGDTSGGETFLSALDRIQEDGRQDYLPTIQSLPYEDAMAATLWMSAVVSHVRGRVMELLPTLNH